MSHESRDTARIQVPSRQPPKERSVLVVDDEPGICRVADRVLGAAGFVVTTTTDSTKAIETIMRESFDVILSDVVMPNMTGVELLRVVRAYDLDVPVILMTGNPSIETAAEAVALGALQYLPKPTPNEVLVEAVERASRLHRLALMKREALKLGEQAQADAENRASLGAAFDRALDTMWMAFQPIVASNDRRVFGYEALLRTKEPILPHPGAVLDAAERLGRVHELGRRVRALSAAAFASAAPKTLLFVNLHTSDLLDDELYDATSPLRQMADQVVLELTERAAIESVKDITARIATLRLQGFRVAIDDLGAGYAGLASFAALEPDLVKLDMSLVRDIHESPVKQRLVTSMAALCREMHIDVVAEGVETRHERDFLHGIDCTLLQGYLFAKPGPPFPSPSFP